MAHLYVTTDSYEARTLVEEEPYKGQKLRYRYHKIEAKHGMDLVKRIGFNPMASIELNGDISEKELGGIIKKLIKERLSVATEINGSIKQYIF